MDWGTAAIIALAVAGGLGSVAARDPGVYVRSVRPTVNWIAGVAFVFLAGWLTGIFVFREWFRSGLIKYNPIDLLAGIQDFYLLSALPLGLSFGVLLYNELILGSLCRLWQDRGKDGSK